MCLIVFDINNFEPLISDKDILVYKVLKSKENGWETPVQHQPVYFYNGVARQRSRLNAVPVETLPCPVGEVGIHAFRSLTDADLKAMARNIENIEVFRAIIPAGTEFYIGEYGDIASAALDIYDGKTRPGNNYITVEDFILEELAKYDSIEKK